MKKYISLKQASQVLNRSTEELQKMCQSGFLDAKIVGSQWFVDASQRIGPGDSTPGRVTDLRQSLAMILIILFFSVGMAQMAQINLPVLNQAVAQVSMSQVLDDWLEVLGNFLIGLPTTFDFLKDRLVSNWQHFLGIAPPEEVAGPATKPAELLPMPTDMSGLSGAEIQKLVDDRVAAYLRQFGRSVGTVSGGAPSSGLVVVPSTGNISTDRALSSRLGEAFSDRVVISLDPSGLTGIITPIFQRVAGENYLFLLTPVRPQ